MHRFDKLSIMPKTEHMRADEFLHRNLKENNQLETWDGELYLEMHRGTFTTKAVLKDYNRRLETKMRAAELLCVLRMKKRKGISGKGAAQLLQKAAVKSVPRYPSRQPHPTRIL